MPTRRRLSGPPPPRRRRAGPAANPGEAPSGPPSRLAETYRTMAHLRRFFESVRRTLTAEPAEGGLPPAQQFALLTLAGSSSGEPLTIGDLARQTFATMNTTSALVRRMELAGLVRTSRSSSDRRFVYVKLTPLGERRLRPSTAAVVEALRKAADEQGRAQL